MSGVALGLVVVAYGLDIVWLTYRTLVERGRRR
jgi:hypothetical protein